MDGTPITASKFRNGILALKGRKKENRKEKREGEAENGKYCREAMK